MSAGPPRPRPVFATAAAAMAVRSDVAAVPDDRLPGLADAFAYRAGVLSAEDVALPDLAAHVGTPLYVYSQAALLAAYDRMATALDPLGARICFAVKANSNQAVIATFARRGAGADVVSEGELARALAAGVPGERIVFAGVGKTRGELAAAVAAGVGSINVESEPELEALAEVATAMGRTARVALRVNPDVDAATHAKISTGRKENKFGIDFGRAATVAARAAALPGLAFQGLACHIGSQLTSLAPFREAFQRLADLVTSLRGAGIAVSHLDLGGGIGVGYAGETPPSVEAYADVVRETVGGLGCALVVEPGRSLVAQAGVLLTRVIYVKEGEARRFVIVDAAMNDLLRPAMYEAFHAVLPVRRPQPDARATSVDLVGPVCESSDIFARDRPLTPTAEGDLLALGTAGAYGAVMASTYNTRPLVPEVMVSGGRYAVIRPRPALADLIALDRLPPWLAPA